MWSSEQYAEESNAQPGAFTPPSAPAALTQGAPVPAPLNHAQVAVQPQHAPVQALPQGAFDIPPSLGERVELCKLFSDSDLVPRALQKKPANILLIMHKALALDLPLMVAIEHMHVVDGKVGHSAELLRGLVARAGHVLRWLSISDKEATGELVLRHDPRNPRRETFTIADATRMKLTTKDNWAKDPASMMVARVTTRLVSRHCPEIAVALGNLSAIDFEEEPAAPVAATAEAGPSLEAQAAGLLAQARAVTTSAKLQAIGKQAREDGLLEVTVEGDTLQNHLLARINEIAEARKQDEVKAEARKQDEVKAQASEKAAKA